MILLFFLDRVEFSGPKEVPCVGVPHTHFIDFSVPSFSRPSGPAISAE